MFYSKLFFIKIVFLHPLCFFSFPVPDGPPLKITVVEKSSSSLLVRWNQPEISKRNGIIVNYTVCTSHQESEPCLKEYTTSEKMLVIGNLKVSTKYYVRVLASTKIGRGMYSNSTKKFTYAGNSNCNVYIELMRVFSVQLLYV